MPIHITDPSSDQICIDSLVDHLIDNRFDPTDHHCLMETAPFLKRLANNQTFLSDLICSEIENYHILQEDNPYVPQVFMLDHDRLKEKSTFLRACLWPGTTDEILTSSGHKAFYYGLPHDHNFNFLTVGYAGPGYVSDYYEYDYAAVVGLKGEEVDLQFKERSQLTKGHILLYRAFRDVHSQYAPESFSVSLNIMENTCRSAVMDQYTFEPGTNRISSSFSRCSPGALFSIIASTGGAEGQSLLSHIFQHHPVDRIRMSALESLMTSAADTSTALAFGSLVSVNHSRFMRERARTLIGRMESASQRAS